MDEFSVVDELSVILMFLNPFLAKLPDEAREGLCRRMALESINRDQSIYKQGEEVPCFFLILSGELCSTIPILCSTCKQVASQLMMMSSNPTCHMQCPRRCCV